MSSFDRRSLLLALAALSACGFTPVYGPASDLRGNVQVGSPNSANAFTLVRQLELRFGPPTTPRYTLAVGVELDEEGSVITRSSEVERFTISGSANFTFATADGELILRGMTRSSTSYSASGTPISARAARDDAQERLMIILADQITARVAASTV
ncbi:MAG: LPS assembly lipoprotein LptE [Pseudomonadota bacterium]